MISVEKRKYHNGQNEVNKKDQRIFCAFQNWQGVVHDLLHTQKNTEKYQKPNHLQNENHTQKKNLSQLSAVPEE